jgi:hypothetical protein
MKYVWDFLKPFTAGIFCIVVAGISLGWDWRTPGIDTLMVANLTMAQAPVDFTIQQYNQFAAIMNKWTEEYAKGKLDNSLLIKGDQAWNRFRGKSGKCE